MAKTLTVTLETEVYEKLCEIAGGSDEYCVSYIEGLVRGNVISRFVSEESRHSSQDKMTEEEAHARHYLKRLYQSGQLDLALESPQAPRWVELAHQAMAAGDSWEGSAERILELGYREMAADEEREVEADEWAEGLIGDVLLENEDADGSR